MRSSSSDRIVKTPLTLTLSPRIVVSFLRDSLAGERGQMQVSLLTTLQAARSKKAAIRDVPVSCPKLISAVDLSG
jgi:hypothetical protein